MEAQKTQKTIYLFEYKGIKCQILFWTMPYMEEDLDAYKNGGIWTSYIFFSKQNNKELFDKFILSPEEGKYGCIYDYWNLDIDFHGGTTLYERIFDQFGNIIAIKIGNDYNHIWNGGETYKKIENDLKETVDKLLDNTNL